MNMHRFVEMNNGSTLLTRNIKEGKVFKTPDVIMEYILNLQRKFSAQTQNQNFILLNEMPELV